MYLWSNTNHSQWFQWQHNPHYWMWKTNDVTEMKNIINNLILDEICLFKGRRTPWVGRRSTSEMLPSLAQSAANDSSFSWSPPYFLTIRCGYNSGHYSPQLDTISTMPDEYGRTKIEDFGKLQAFCPAFCPRTDSNNICRTETQNSRTPDTVYLVSYDKY